MHLEFLFIHSVCSFFYAFEQAIVKIFRNKLELLRKCSGYTALVAANDCRHLDGIDS